jgi:integrase
MATIEKRTSKEGDISYRVKIRMLGHKPENATFTSLTKAKRWAQDIESAIRDGRHFKVNEAKKHTMGDLIDKYLRVALPENEKHAAITKAQLLWWKDRLGVKLLSDITSAAIVEQRDFLLSEPIVSTRRVKLEDGNIEEIVTRRKRSRSTVVRYLAALSTAYTQAVKEWKWVARDQNPMPDVKKPKEANGRVRFLSDDERVKLLQACKLRKNKHLYLIVLLAVSTGARKGEIMNLTWDDVSFDHSRIILRDTKNGETRSVPLAGVAFDLMRVHSDAKRTDTSLVFPRAGIKGDKPMSIREAWLAAVAESGVADFRFHDLRHTAASYLAMNGASLAEIAEVLGHKTLQMVKRYAHLSESHTLGVVERMNQKIFGTLRD